MKVGMAGSFDSCDVLITVIEHEKLEVEIDSIVENQFKEEIEKVIKTTLQALQIEKLKVIVKDKGALNYTIRARLLSALSRMRDDNA